MRIRSYSWGAANISWSVVIEELLYAAEHMGHEVVFLSTNGHRGMQYWSPDKSLEQEFFMRKFLREKGAFDIDLTYTVPQNFPQRFINSSRCKMAIYAYESSIMPRRWRDYYHIIDYVLPPSQYVADMMERNGCPKEKIKVVPHGVDTDLFHPGAKPLDLKIDKKFKFLCVAEPHYRKQLDKLLEVYCKWFTSDDDVCLVLKTKIFNTAEDYKNKKEFEQDLKPVIKALQDKYGDKMPAIKVVTKRFKNLANLYAACDAFCLMTASEGWGVPYLEALAMGMPVIAPRHGGQLQFLNDENAILTKCGTRKARTMEQYWGASKGATVGDPDEEEFGMAMRQLYSKMMGLVKPRSLGPMIAWENLNRLDEMKENAIKTAQSLTWKSAMQQIIDIAAAHNDRT